MKLILKLIISIIVIIAGLIWLLYLDQPEPIEKKYANYSEAISGNALDTHWIPSLMPQSATNIHVIYGVDPSFLRLQFSYLTNDEKKITHGFRKLTNSDAIKRVIHRMDKMTWKTDVTTSSIIFVPNESDENGFSNEQIFLAIDKINNVAWYSIN